MTHSRHTAAHFTYVEECDMTELVELRAKAKDIAEKRGVKLTYLPFIVKALVVGLKEHPLLNASLDDERQEVVLKRYYNIGIATAAPEGLIVPVVKDCERRGILEIAREIDRISNDARDGKSKLEDLQGGTFSITSLGAIGGLLATPIINHPEVAILGVHKIAKRPVVKDDDRIVIRHMMNLAISLDHRVVDGAVGAAFLQRVIRFLEDPKLLLLEGL
jgi:pyruvate dehydrogenase E2 component (dihydrolipoamide acetyltransferase)